MSTTVRLDTEATRRVLIAGLWLKAHDTAENLVRVGGSAPMVEDFLSSELPGLPDEFGCLVEAFQGINAGIDRLYAASAGDEVDLPTRQEDIAWAVYQATEGLAEYGVGHIPTEALLEAGGFLKAGRGLVEAFPMTSAPGPGGTP